VRRAASSAATFLDLEHPAPLISSSANLDEVVLEATVAVDLPT